MFVFVGTNFGWDRQGGNVGIAEGGSPRSRLDGLWVRCELLDGKAEWLY
jgi:hypothetical protein